MRSPVQTQKVLLFADETAAACSKGRSWMAEALLSFGIEVAVEPLLGPMRTSIELAQKRQYR
jgi:hypothetical protein